jgi:hypothetical protein
MVGTGIEVIEITVDSEAGAATELAMNKRGSGNHE